MKTLIVIDMQNDFIDGTLGTKEAQDIVLNVAKKIDNYRSLGYQIIFTRDTHNDDYLMTYEGRNLPIKHCIKDSFGWQITDKINIKNTDIIIDKYTFGYDWAGNIEDIHNFILGNEIEIVGLCTDICVISNVLILKSIFNDRDIIVDANCCAGTTDKNHKNALEVMKACQVKIV